MLLGQRRVGKTSILPPSKAQPTITTLRTSLPDLQGRARKPLGSVLYDIASAFVESTDMTPIQPHQFDNEGNHFRHVSLPALYSERSDRRAILLLDEFDVLDMAAGEHLLPSAAANALFGYLRQLLTEERELGFVFVVGRRTEDLSINSRATFRSTRFKRVSVLSEIDARQLILTAERQGTLAFDDNAVDRIYSLTAGHPYFTQLFCRTLWESAAEQSPRLVPRVTFQIVEKAIEQVLEAGNNVFEWIWDGLPTVERLISLLLRRRQPKAR